MKGLKGNFMITFSGIDCSGKSTQIENVTRILNYKGQKCKVIWSRGGYTPILEFVKNIIRTDYSLKLKRPRHKPGSLKVIILWEYFEGLNYYT